MRLWEYQGKNIKVICIDGQVLEGKCVTFTSKIDSEDGMASIDLRVIRHKGYLIQILEDEIKSIEIV